jgi:hypothetical protein
MCIATNGATKLPLAAQDVCFNAGGIFSSGCNGGQISTPWSYIKRTGAVTGGNYGGTGPMGGGYCSAFSLPHCHHHGPQGDDPCAPLPLRRHPSPCPPSTYPATWRSGTSLVASHATSERARERAALTCVRLCVRALRARSYPAEGAPGCPSERSPRGPTSCDSDAQAPHTSFSADKYTYTGTTQSASGVSRIQQMIMEGGPVETAFTVYSDFEDYAGGVYQHTTGSSVGGHAVKIVGWGVDSGTAYWKIANSWNPYWGENGYFRIAHGEGGIDDQVIASASTATWGKKN